MRADNRNIYSKGEFTMDASNLPKQSGVYKIVNTENGFTYTGSAERLGIYGRILQHLNHLRKNKHHSYILQQDWNKYGESKFKVEVVILCSIADTKKIEQALIDAQGVGRDHKSYNISPGACGLRMSAEVKQKILMARRKRQEPLPNNKSGHRGVCFYKREGKWKASIGREGHCYHIGYYETPEEAREAYVKINALSDNEFKQWWKTEYETKRKDGQYKPKGENASWAKLKDIDIDEIRRLWANREMNQKQIADKYNIHQAAVSNIVNNKRRKTNE